MGRQNGQQVNRWTENWTCLWVDGWTGGEVRGPRCLEGGGGEGFLDDPAQGQRRRWPKVRGNKAPRGQVPKAKRPTQP